MKLKIFLMCLFTVTFTHIVSGQQGASLSFTQRPTEKIENDFDIVIKTEILISRIELAKEFVVALSKDENSGLTEVNNILITHAGNNFFLNGDQLIQGGVLRYVTSFHKDLLLNNKVLVFYIIDNSGQSSNKITYSLKP